MFDQNLMTNQMKYFLLNVQIRLMLTIALKNIFEKLRETILL